MDTEIEAKFPDIDPIAFRAKLKEIGASLEYSERLMRRKNFDYPDHHLGAMNAWVRVRDEGDIVTVSYKQMDDRTLHGMKEISFVAKDFEKACAFLEAIGLAQKSYQESKREKWILDKTEITIDTWPWIPTFTEIEALSEEDVRRAAKLLDLEWSQAMHGSVENVYQMHYNVTEQEIDDDWKSITFIPTPD